MVASHNLLNINCLLQAPLCYCKLHITKQALKQVLKKRRIQNGMHRFMMFSLNATTGTIP